MKNENNYMVHKIYQANSELEQIFLENGFIEVTDNRTKDKRKKIFKLTRNARKQIYFDYEYIKIYTSFHGEDSCSRMTHDELKGMLMFFILKGVYFKEVFFDDGHFKFKDTVIRLNELRNELKDLIQFDLRKNRQVKLEKILNTYDNLEI